MSVPGAPDREYVAARRALLDALAALGAHLDALVLVGAQAIYLHTGEGDLAVAPYTTDGDLAIDPAALRPQPEIAASLEASGFTRSDQPGIWAARGGVKIDLLVPESLGGHGRRGARLGAHGNQTARKVRGLEATLVDNMPLTISSLEPGDDRSFVLKAAGMASLAVAKLHKLSDREGDPDRESDKDALDVLRMLRAADFGSLSLTLRDLSGDPRCAEVTQEALRHLGRLFGSAAAPGSLMAARAAQPLENPATIAMSCAALTTELLTAVTRPAPG